MEGRSAVSSDQLCAVCGKPGTSKWTVGNRDETNNLSLCLTHAEPVRMLLGLTPGTAKNYDNPGHEQLSRKWVHVQREFQPMDWFPLHAPGEDSHSNQQAG